MTHLSQGRKAMFKKGDKVLVDTMGYGYIYKSYQVENKILYQIKQKEFLLGNIPENYITKLS